MPTNTRTPYKAEWWVGPIGVDHYYTQQEHDDAVRRAARRGFTTDEPYGSRQAVTLTIVRPEVRQCRTCGDRFEPNGWTTTQQICPGCKARHATNARKDKSA